MSRIRVLSEVVANRIAAGEVVERPASVLKELVENAIDAESTRIEIQIRAAGRSLIQVTDNGCGMDREDLLLAFERHATSKIRSFEDLEALSTLGFRGEALPSIASVSRVEVKTREAEAETGWYIAMEAGRIVRVEAAAAPHGTTFAVKNLFYNVPARRRFLKSNATEFGHIHVRFKRFALSRPELAWRFLNDDELLYELSAGDMQLRVTQLFGEKTADDLRPIDWEENGVKLSGFVGTASLLRVQRGDQHLYLNNRFIRSPLITNAVIAGLGQIVEPGTFPFYLLFVDMPSEQFDINVHPSKEEVKFDNESFVRRVVLDAVRDALRKGGLTEPAHRFGAESTGGKPLSQRLPAREDRFAATPKRESNFFDRPQGYVPVKYRDRPESQITFLPTKRTFDDQPAELASASDESALRQLAEGFGRGEAGGLWQLQGKYIVVQVPSGLVVVDQHVAHERILYERVVKEISRDGWQVQELLFPLEISADPEDVATADELKEQLSRIGFRIAVKDPTTLILQGTPQGLKITDELQLIKQMLDLYRRDFEARPEQMDRLAATFACKAAVKAGMPLALLEMQTLLEELFRCDLPYVCPHGRPVLIQLTIDELDRRFGRTGG